MKLYDTAEFRSYAGLDDGAKVAKVAEVVRKPTPKNPDQAGGRNNYFASLAGKMRRAGLTAEAILAAIKQDNAEKGYDLPERELVTIARSIGSYDAGDSAEGGASAVLDGNVIQGLINHGIRIDAAGRLREIATGAIAARLTVPRLTNLIWSDLRQIKKAPAEDIGRLLDVEIYRAQRREFDRIAGKVVGRPETPEALEELRRFVRAVGGTDDKAVVGGFLQFLWCVKRSLAGLEREHDIMPVLYNQIQGNGKSTAVRRLVSPLEELVDSITAETLADDRKRPDLGRFVVGVWDEMEGADRKDTEAIKNAISCQDVSYRPMKTNDNVSIRRLMNFIGTSNKPLAAMMRDSSGNRRFLEVETPAQLDQEAINEIDYDLLWQAVSERSRAPAKQVIGEIRTHQAGGRFQDTISLWLESQDFSAYTDGRVPVDEMRALYTTWCDRSKDSPVPTFVFNHRLAGEGYKKTRCVTAGGVRLTVFAPPASTPAATLNQVEHNKIDATKTRQHISREIQEVMTKSHTATRKVTLGGKADFPEAENALAPRLSGWPKPPRPGLELWVYDCEVFPDRFMFSAFNGKEWAEFDETTLGDLAAWLCDKGKTLAGFNSHGYDDILCGAIAADPTVRNAASLYALSCRVINPPTEGDKDANFKARYKRRPWAYSIDVFQLLNAKGALKEWECRIGFPTVAESPAAFDKPLAAELVPAVRQYCRNDVLATAKLLTDRWPLVLLRETLAKQFDLGDRAYCLSEQGLAQATFLTLHRYRTGEKSGEVRAKADKAPENQAEEFPLAEVISDRVAFTTEPFQAMLAKLRAGVLLNDKGWKILSDWKPIEPFKLAGVDLSVMVGGLHSVDGPGTFVADADTAIVDLDVTSYYPSLMLAEKVYPSQLGESFLEDFRTIRDQRVTAKKAGDKAWAEALKIVLNATFGKLNDAWSPIRSVKNAFRVTMNGQMFLLMLIEALHAKGFKILSANTDGLMILAPRSLLPTLAGVTAPWEAQTGLTLERTDYARVCRRDVNAYVALSEDGKIKTKGPFNSEGGKGDGRIIREAAIAYLLHGTDPAKSVADETDPTAFLFYQRAKNGGDLYHGSTFIGKTARWYAAGDDSAAIRRKNQPGSKSEWDTIPNAHQAGMALDITGWTVESMPGLDRAFYVAAAWDLIRETTAC